jgi:membrane protein
MVGFWMSTYARYARHRGSVLAGGLSFFALLSLVPALISLGAVAALLFDPAEFAAEITTLIDDRPELLETLAPVLDQIAGLSQVTLSSIGLAGLIGAAVALYAASRFVYVGRQVLDIAFELEPQHPSLLGRGISVVITLLAQVAIVAGVIAVGVVPRALETLGVGAAFSENVRIFRLPVAVAVIYLLLTAALRYGIRERKAVGWVNLGSALGTLLILVGTLGLSTYLTASSTYSQIVAVLGSVVALQIWLYVIGLAIVGSAEIEGMRLGFRRRDLSLH